MNFSILSKSLITTIVVTIAAYFVAPATDTLSPALLIACGAATGGLLVSLVAAMKSTPSSKRTSTRTADKQNTSSNGDSTTLFVGNLAYKASARDLRTLFEEYGTVHSARIVTDRATRRPRGYGFVEIDSQAADAAIQALNDFDFSGRTLNVNVARPRAESNN